MTRKQIIIAIIAVGALALAMWGYWEGRGERAAEAERERPVNAPSRVSQDNGTAVISLTATSLETSGIAIALPSAATYHATQPAFAAVIAPNDLIDLRTALVGAQAHADQAQATAQASRAEYDRLKGLHQENHDVSDKDFQAAEAAWRADEAALRAARQSLSAAQQIARQQWGAALTAAALNSSPLWTRLIARDSALLQITLAAGIRIEHAPQTALVRLPDGQQQSGQFLSPAPRTDPRLQGMSFFYTLQTDTLPPGVSLSASLPVGAAMEGTVVPASAVVWWQGSAWVYAQSAPGQFRRLALPTGNPSADGWFVPKAFASGQPIVTTGAQSLLSEEQRAQVSVGEEGR